MEVNITIPVHNEERILKDSLTKIINFLTGNTKAEASDWIVVDILPQTINWEIAIAENGSTDKTFEVAVQLYEQFNLAFPNIQIKIFHIDKPGRGRALTEAWLKSNAQILSYMDVDLSANLKDYPKLIKPLIDNKADISIGCRLTKGAQVKRSIKRELMSRIYNLLVRTFLKLPIKDTQCGFKAIKSEAARQLLPLIQNNNWFWDTELLWLATQHRFKITEIPVHWIEDPDSRVKILPTVIEDLKGILRLWRK